MNLLIPFIPILVGTTTSGMTSILTQATEVLTWFITSMGSLLTFITEHPVILVLFMVFLVGSAVGMLMRIWKSV